MSDNNSNSSSDDEEEDDESYREDEKGATTAMNTAIPIAASLGASKRKPKRKRFHLPEGFPKRPLSAYNLFFKETRADILSKSKSGKVAFGGVAKEIGARWNRLPTRDRSKYEQQAAQDLLRYRAEITTFEKNLAVQQQKADDATDDGMEQDGDKKPAALQSTQRKRSSDLPVIPIPEHVTTTESERMAQFSALPPKIQEGLLRYAQQTWPMVVMESSPPVPALSSSSVAQAQSPATLPPLPTDQASSTSASAVGSSVPARNHPPPQHMYSRRLLTNAGALPPGSSNAAASLPPPSLEEQLASLLGVQQQQEHNHPPALASNNGNSNDNAIQDLAALLLPPAPSSDPTGMLLQALLGQQQQQPQPSPVQNHNTTESLPELLIQTLLQQQTPSSVPAPLPFWPQQQPQPSSSVALEDLLRQLSANHGSIHVNPQNHNNDNDNARNKHHPDARRR